ncbi:MAG: zinc ribbon domain-containing protein [Clostridia bacterium]|nr:zinc ribbon domain-containing protein [Clostridia bacterium]
MKLCPKCKAELADNVKFCSNCGYAFKETVVKTAPAVTEKSAEDLFDHKPLVMEWYEKNGFVRFMFNVWPKLNLFGSLLSTLCMVLGAIVFLGGLFRELPDAGEIIPEFFSIDTGMGIFVTALVFKALFFAANMVFNNDLKKILFSKFLKKKGVDLDVATKYVFKHISKEAFYAVSKREKGALVVWLEKPQYFGEAVMMAVRAEAKKANLVWLCVTVGVAFVCQVLESSMIPYLAKTMFTSFDFATGSIDDIGAVFGTAIIYIAVIIVCTIVSSIVLSIGAKKKAETRGVWAFIATNSEEQK